MHVDEKHYVAVGMSGFESKFVRALGNALFSADRQNTAKIKENWPALWKTAYTSGIESNTALPRPPGVNTLFVPDERFYVVMGMTVYGGHFVRKLGIALSWAELEVIDSVKEIWPEYWKEYLELSKQSELNRQP